MSEIVGMNTCMGIITRLYVWYPTREAGSDWANDPAIQNIVVGLQQRAVIASHSARHTKFGYEVDGTPYYWHKYASGCVYVITICERNLELERDAKNALPVSRGSDPDESGPQLPDHG